LIELIEQDLVERFALKLGYPKIVEWGVDWHLWRMVFDSFFAVYREWKMFKYIIW
jgi:hypothetical protein